MRKNYIDQLANSILRPHRRMLIYGFHANYKRIINKILHELIFPSLLNNIVYPHQGANSYIFIYSSNFKVSHPKLWLIFRHSPLEPLVVASKVASRLMVNYFAKTNLTSHAMGLIMATPLIFL